MKKLILVLCFLSFIFLIPTASAAWTDQWHFDVASFDYNQFLTHYTTWGRIHYRSETQGLAANTIDNGVGSAGKPILEVYLTGGMAYGEATDAGIPNVPGSVYCINGATGAQIWHMQDEESVWVHTCLELGDCNDDGHLELLVSDYCGIMLLNAQTGSIIWKKSWSSPGNTPEIVNHRIDKHNSIIRDPSNG